MFYSLKYLNKFKDEAQEIKIDFNQLGSIYDYIKEHPDKRYNIRLTGDLIPENFKQQMTFVTGVVDQNYTISCYKFDLLLNLRKNGYNAYLDLPITDWETFRNLENWGVSDIYVDGPLAFSCDKLKLAGPKIRISPTISAGRGIFFSQDVDTFFIRPEDLHYYEDFIIDFKMSNYEKEQAVYEIYRSKVYLFDLQLLIDNLNVSCQNMFVPKDFGENRLNCQQICKVPGRNCHFCQSCLNAVNAMMTKIKNKSEKK